MKFDLGLPRGLGSSLMTYGHVCTLNKHNHNLQILLLVMDVRRTNTLSGFSQPWSIIPFLLYFCIILQTYNLLTVTVTIPLTLSYSLEYYTSLCLRHNYTIHTRYIVSDPYITSTRRARECRRGHALLIPVRFAFHDLLNLIECTSSNACL